MLPAMAVAMLIACLTAGIAYFSARPPVDSATGLDLAAALEQAHREKKPLLVVFTHPSAALAQRMAETISALPVVEFLRVHYVTLTLDSVVGAGYFRRWLGGAGLLGSCVLDVDRDSEPSVVAALPGFAEAPAYLQFLAEVSRNVPSIRQLRTLTSSSPEARLALGDLYRTSGNLLGARASFSSVTIPLNLRAEGLERLARLDVDEGRITEARQTLVRARALKIEPPSERLVFTEGSLLSAERHVDEAVTALERGLPFVRSPAERGQCLLLLADLNHELGRDPQAFEQLARLSDPAFGTTFQRAADERVSHLLHPDPGHVH